IDEKILQRARQGIYHERALKEVPNHFKERYFKHENSLYMIDENLKRPITFRSHNLLSDPYTKGFDLIICRNVIIYFTDVAKTEIYEKFSQSLNNEVVFFVGSTEQIFTPENYHLKLFDTFFY